MNQSEWSNFASRRSLCAQGKGDEKKDDCKNDGGKTICCTQNNTKIIPFPFPTTEGLEFASGLTAGFIDPITGFTGIGPLVIFGSLGNSPFTNTSRANYVIADGSSFLLDPAPVSPAPPTLSTLNLIEIDAYSKIIPHDGTLIELFADALQVATTGSMGVLSGVFTTTVTVYVFKAPQGSYNFQPTGLAITLTSQSITPIGGSIAMASASVDAAGSVTGSVPVVAGDKIAIIVSAQNSGNLVGSPNALTIANIANATVRYRHFF